MLGKGKGARHTEGRKPRGQAVQPEQHIDGCLCRPCRRMRARGERKAARP